MKRVSALLLLLALAGCGDKTEQAAPVRLSVDSPSDLQLLHESSVEVHGVVSPRTAEVTVEGKPVQVRRGGFSTRVELLPGTNLIDVVAGAKGARPAMVALRVRRQVSVEVPDLTGFTPGDAKDALAGKGLEPDVQEAGGLIELLLPEDARVCEQDPQPGTSVDPGSTVHVLAAKRC